VLRDWRALAGLLALVVAAVVAFVALGGGDDAPPSGEAAKLVPANALAYVHVSTDDERAPVRRGVALLRRLGAGDGLSAQLSGLLSAREGQPVDFGRDVRPWLGDEAALAITRGRGTTAGSLLLLSVADEGRARDFLARNGGRARRAERDGVEVSTYANGAVAAFVDGFLAIGQQGTVATAIDLSAGKGGARPLADDATYLRATAGQPDERVLDGYAAVDGVRRLLAPQSGLLGLAGAMLDQPGLRAAAIAVSAGKTTARVSVRQLLDPRGRSAAPRFTPTLTRSVPERALAYAGFTSVERAVPLLFGLGGVGGGTVGDTAELVRAAGRVLSDSGVSFARDVLPLFGKEVAVTIVDANGAPGVVLLARTPDEQRTATALRGLEPAIAKLFAPEGGVAPAFGDGRVGDVATRKLQTSDGVELHYALHDGTLALSTSEAALASVLRPQGTIADNPDYKAVIPDSQSELTSIVFFDFSQLLSLFEPLGLTGASGLFADLQSVRAVGLTSLSGEAQTTAELTFEIP
jgi:hypothetical protein